MNFKAFFDSIRPHVGLTVQNVPNFERIIKFGEVRGTDLFDMAYILATAYWESARTMAPVVEAYWKSEAWRAKNLRYYPWHGRGLIQTTWKENYIKIAKAIQDDYHLPEAPKFTKDPDLLLRWEWALPALFVGMERGIYTGKKLDDFIDALDESDDKDFEEYKAARAIVNGKDRDDDIATLALAFEDALKAGGYEGRNAARINPQIPEPEWRPEVPDFPVQSLIDFIIKFIKRIFGR